MGSVIASRHIISVAGSLLTFCGKSSLRASLFLGHCDCCSLSKQERCLQAVSCKGCKLRQCLFLQTKMAQEKWGEIDYERVASLCMKINKSHFSKHDKERLTVRPAFLRPCCCHALMRA